MATRKKLSFEEGMEQLEGLVGQMEKGELPLDQSFAAYEKGMELIRALRAQLDQGEARIVELTERGDKPFEEEAQ